MKRLILDTDELKETRKNYAEILFSDKLTNISGPKIVESEVRYLMDYMKNGKSPGLDNNYAEVLKLVDVKQIT